MPDLPQNMRAMILAEQRQALSLSEVARPKPKAGELLLRVRACGVCRTDLHVVDGDLTEPALPLIPGHQIVGEVVGVGAGVDPALVGKRMGVPWLGGACGCCDYCNASQENLCDKAVYTGYQRNGGFAEYVTANADFCFPLPANYSNEQVAPLLCAGLIGYRAYRAAGDVQRLGLYGFGAAAHILAQVAAYEDRETYAFTRPGDTAAQNLAMVLGAAWAGDSVTPAPVELDAAIIFAPDGALVPTALKAVRKGGRVICAGIHMSDIPAFSYADLWGERRIESVANLTRRDGEQFLPLAASIPVRTEVHVYPLEQANQALDDLRGGRFAGAAVVVP
jgi:propanol-preferring alcohol dehydrogenase